MHAAHYGAACVDLRGVRMIIAAKEKEMEGEET